MRSFRARLLLAFLLVSLAGTALALVLIGRTAIGRFDAFLARRDQEALAEELAAWYATNGSWEGLAAIDGFGGMGMGQGMVGGMGPRHMQMMGGGATLVDASDRVVWGSGPHRPGERLSPAELNSGTPVLVDGRRVGIVVLSPGFGLPPSPAELGFLGDVRRALVISSLAATTLALVLGALLSRRLTGYLRQLRDATRRVAAGDLEVQLPVRSKDELGELASSFNQMSADLARARDLRRQMTADIAHELRTPLSVVLGHVEGLRDGVVKPDRETLALLHDETLRLKRLVEELRTLSLAEAGELSLILEPEQVETLIERAVSAHAPAAAGRGIALTAEAAGSLPRVVVDADRMAQVLDNLIENALRHVTAGGRIWLWAAAAGEKVRLEVGDTGPGIPPQDLPHIFQRFYRTDRSRARKSGGSGLGLAIARSIVVAHGGRIWAESGPGKGAKFIVEIPAVPV